MTNFDKSQLGPDYCPHLSELSPEQAADLEAEVRQAYDYGIRGDKTPVWGRLTYCVMNYGPKALTEMTLRVDPERKVFDAPVRPGEVGRGGFKMAEGRYTFCSNVYGHEITNFEGDEAFLSACEEAYDDGRIHDCGHVVVDRDEGRPGVLLVSRLEQDTVPDPADLAELSVKHGVVFECLSWPRIPAVSNFKDDDYTAITCLLTDPGRFAEARDMVCDMREMEQRWRGAGPAAPKP
jgi:hypothetical protein